MMLLFLSILTLVVQSFGTPCGRQVYVWGDVAKYDDIGPSCESREKSPSELEIIYETLLKEKMDESIENFLSTVLKVQIVLSFFSIVTIFSVIILRKNDFIIHLDRKFGKKTSIGAPDDAVVN
ncbi:uncharacterized protein LOC106673966 [Cimex lectularius]|uniref:Uncharacterized protein n=1 Tax=Cimex lectularius TaxID=79782 RepID=A0A8I6SCI4_CIMLE|nr:uncharacterized protein LOC106673966 [Cimex lectularius]